MADPTSDTPANAPDDIRPRATIKLKPMTPPDAAVGQASDPAASEESAVHISPPPSTSVPGVKQTIKLRAPSAPAADASEVKPAIKIVPKAAEAPTGIPTAKPVDAGSFQTEQAAQPQSAPIRLKKPESSTPTAQMKAPDPAIRTIRLNKTAEPETPPIQLNKSESSVPTSQLQKPESSSPTIRLKKPEAAPASPSTATIQLKKPENTSEPTVQAKKVGEAPVPPERKLTLKLKSKPAQQKELPKNIIPGLNIPNTPPPVQKEGEQQPAEAAPQQQPPVAAPVETQTPVPEAVPEDKKKKGKLPKVKKQPAPPSSADEPNWFFLTLSCLTLIAVCFIAYLLFAQYMNMYEGMQIPIPEFLMPK